MLDETACILLAAGSGTRTGIDQRKQFVRIAGKTVLEHSVEALRQHIPQALVIVVAPHDALEKVKLMFAEDAFVRVIAGGASRQASTLRGLRALYTDQPINVLIHDAARPFLDARIIEDVLLALKEHEAVDVAIPTADTIIAERDGFIDHIPKRSYLLRGQTPQAFRYRALLSCYEQTDESKLDQFTDDCGLFLACNPQARIRIVRGNEENFKITHPIDLILADEMFRLRTQSHTMDKPGFDLRNKRVLIFGGTRGIGRAMADIMHSAGANVVARSRENGCDITREADVAAALEEMGTAFGGIDVVVNAAGLLRNGSLSEQSTDDIAAQVAVNFTGALHVARHAYHWLKQSQGSLLLFSSSSYTRGRSGYVTYSATKAAIVNLTQGLSEEWADDGIRVNCVIPGRTDTAMRQSNFLNEDPETLMNAYQVGLTAVRLAGATTTCQITRCDS